MTLTLAPTADACLITGAPQTGKTRMLIEHVGMLLESDVAPDDILVIAASPTACTVMQRALTDAGFKAIEVHTVRAIALHILQNPEAQRATGRHGHMLSGYEESFLLEDMKTCGLRPKRIREMLRFFFRSWTELSHLEGNWLAYKEEEEVYALLTGLLQRNKAFLEPELSASAYAFLNSNSEQLKRHARDHILVDDYQTLSRASQFLVNLLAQKSITVAGDVYTTVPAFDSYPYAKGIDEFIAANKDAKVQTLTESHLPAGAAALINTLATHAQAELEELGLTVAAPYPHAEGTVVIPLVYDDPQAEIAASAAWVEQRIAEGIAPRDIVVATPNRTWERHVHAALEAKGIACDYAAAHRNIAGDVRYPETSREARMLCLLMLAAEPTDEPSLRAWCGFGDYLTNSQVFAEIDAYAQKHHKTLVEVLEELASTESVEAFNFEFFREANKVRAAYLQLKYYLSELDGLTGATLIERACGLASVREHMEAPAALAPLVRLETGHETARELRELVIARQTFPAVSDTGVKVIPYTWTSGLQAKAVSVTGLINGFMPPLTCFDTVHTSPEMAIRLSSRAARVAIAACSAGAEQLAVSYFNEMGYEESQALHAKVERIYARDDKRFAKTSPSILLEELKLSEY